MIVSNRRYMFGMGHVGVVQNKSFRCAVSTAPEGLFKGYSILIQAFDGEWGVQRNQMVVAKAMLNPGMAKKQMSDVFSEFVANIDRLGDNGLGLADAIDVLFIGASERNIFVDVANEAHVLLHSRGCAR